MKKSPLRIVFVVMILVIIACTPTTITDNPGNHRYGLGETINVVDVETRESRGTIAIAAVHVLYDEQFVARQNSNRTDDYGNTIYEERTFQQIVQIFYTSTLSRDITPYNFSVSVNGSSRSATRITNLLNPPNISAVSVSGQNYFIVALYQQANFIEIAFNYNWLQTRRTATARIYSKDFAPIAQAPNAPVSAPPINIAPPTSAPSNEIISRAPSVPNIVSQEPTTTNNNLNNDNAFGGVILFVCIFIAAVIWIVILVLVILLIVRKRR